MASLDSIIRPGSYGYRDVVIMLPLLGFAGAFAALHRIQRERVGRVGRIAYPVMLVALLLLLLGDALHVVDASDNIQVLFMLPVLVWIVSLITYGIVTVRARVVPAVVGLAFAVSQPATMALGVALKPVAGLYDFGSYSGALANSIAFLLVGVCLQAWAFHRVSDR